MEKVQDVKDKQKSEAFDTWESLKKSKDVITARRDYYRDILPITQFEIDHLKELHEAFVWGQRAQALSFVASVVHALPTVDIGIAGFSGSPKVGVSWGGPNVGAAAQAVSEMFRFIAADHSNQVNVYSITAGYERRWNDWKLQETIAE